MFDRGDGGGGCVEILTDQVNDYVSTCEFKFLIVEAQSVDNHMWILCGIFFNLSLSTTQY